MSILDKLLGNPDPELEKCRKAYQLNQDAFAKKKREYDEIYDFFNKKVVECEWLKTNREHLLSEIQSLKTENSGLNKVISRLENDKAGLTDTIKLMMGHKKADESKFKTEVESFTDIIKSVKDEIKKNEELEELDDFELTDPSHQLTPDLTLQLTHRHTDTNITPITPLSTQLTPDPSTHHSLKLSPTQQKVTDYLKQNPHQTNKSISVALNIDHANISKVLKSMVDKSIIVKNDADNTYELKVEVVGSP